MSINEGKTISEALFQDHHLFLHGDINGDMASAIIAGLLALSNDDKPISLHIFSGGGEIYSGLAIIDAIRSIKAPVYTYAMGLCASMAAIIFVSGDKRFIGANSRFMIHQPLGGASGKLSDMQTTIDEALKLKEIIVEILSAKSELSKEEISKMIEKDKFLSAKECLKIGFCDEILKDKNQIKRI